MRLTVELTRPVPFAGFRIASEITRKGRTVSTTKMVIVDGNGKELVTAYGMHVASPGTFDMPTVQIETPNLDEARPDAFPIGDLAHDEPCFIHAVESKYPPGHDRSPGPTVAWMRTPQLLPDETPSGFQAICPMADCGNAVSRNEEPTRFAFMNTDLTINLHREPEGEWFGMDAVSHWQPNGLGMSDSMLFDATGPVGRVLQTLITIPIG